MLQSHQLDEQDALDEEAEAIRLQKKQAEALNEEDFAVGLGVTPSGKSTGVPTQTKHAIATPATSVEKIQRNTENMTKQEKLQMLSIGACVVDVWLCDRGLLS